MPAAILGQNQANAPVAVSEENKDLEYVTGFLILIDNEGHYVFEPDINKPVIIRRQPTSSEVKGSLSSVIMDISTQETAMLTAQATVNMQMQMARQAYEQQQNQQLIQQLGKTK